MAAVVIPVVPPGPDVAAFAALLGGETEDEFNNTVSQLSANDIVKDFRKSEGPEHFSGDGEHVIRRWIEFKRRLKGCFRRADNRFKHMFVGGNCELSVLHLNLYPEAGKEIIYDVLTLTTSGTAKAITIDYDEELNGSAALIALDREFIKGDLQERTDVKDAIAAIELGKENPQVKLQELKHLFKLRANQLDYDEEERISDLIKILKKNNEYKEFLKTFDILSAAGTAMTISGFMTAIQNYWKQNICEDANDLIENSKIKKKDNAIAGGAEGEQPKCSNCGRTGHTVEQCFAKGGPLHRSKGKGGKKGGKSKGNWQSYQPPNRTQNGSRGGFTGGDGRAPDDPSCHYTCAICGPAERTNQRIPGKMHYPDRCPMRNAVREAYFKNKENPRAETDEERIEAISGAAKHISFKTEPEISYDDAYYDDVMAGCAATTDSKPRIRQLIMTLVTAVICFAHSIHSNAFLRTPSYISTHICSYYTEICLGFMAYHVLMQGFGNTLLNLGIGEIHKCSTATVNMKDAYAAANFDNQSTNEHWLIDSGATFYLSGNLPKFKNINYNASAKSFKVASDKVLTSKGVGEIDLPWKNETTGENDIITLKNVYYCPQQPLNLLSVRQLMDQGFHSPDFESLTIRSKQSNNVYKFHDTGTAYIKTNSPTDGFAAPAVNNGKIYKSTDNWMLDSQIYEEQKHLVSTITESWTELYSSEWNFQEPTHYTIENPFDLDNLKEGNFYANPPFRNAEFHNLFQAFDKAFSDGLSLKVMIICPKIPGASWNLYKSRYRVLTELPKGSMAFSVHRDETYNPEVLTPCPPERANGNQDRVFIQGTPWPVEILYRDNLTLGNADPHDLWHAQHGHPGQLASQHLLHQNPTANRGGEIKADHISKCHIGDHCPVCRLYKRKQPTFKTLDPERRNVLQPFGKLHADLVTLPVPSSDGHVYFAVYTCAKTGYTFGKALQKKSDLSFTTEEIYDRIRTLGHNPENITIRSDAENVFIKGLHADLCRRLGIKLEHSPPYQKQSAGQAENTILQIETISRAIMATTKFPDCYWPLAYRHAVLIKNIRPSSTRHWQIPYFQIHKKHFNDERLYLFGAPASQFLHKVQRTNSKWGYTAAEGLYVGPTTDGNGNLLLDPKTGKIWEAGEIKVNNDLKSLYESISGVQIYPAFNESDDVINADITSKPAEFASKSKAEKIYNDSATVIHSTRRYLDRGCEFQGIILVSTPTISKIWMHVQDFVYLRTDEQDYATRNWDKLAGFINNQKQRGLLSRNFDPLFKICDGLKHYKKTRGLVCSHDLASEHPYGVVWSPKTQRFHQYQDVQAKDIDLSDDKPGLAGAVMNLIRSPIDHRNPNDLANYTAPATWPEALSYPDSKDWKKAMDVQIHNFRRLGTFDTNTPLPKGVKPIKSKFVFKLKTEEVKGVEVIDKYKIRLAAKGYSQIKGDTFNDTFAPVTHIATTKSICAVALDFELELMGLDTKSAFINATIKFDAWVELPEGFTFDGHRIVKLNKTLEGTKQGAHDWFQEQDKLIMRFDPAHISKSPVDPCLYIYKNGSKLAIISVHTDDYLVATNDRGWFDKFYDYYNQIYPSDKKESINGFCGMKIEKDQDQIAFSQAGKIKQFISGLKAQTDLKARSTPARAQALKLPMNEKRDWEIPYESLIGSCLWFARISRPDIMYSTILHSKFTACATKHHYDSALDTVRYLCATPDYKLTFNRSTTPGINIRIQTDSDWASDESDRKSHQGYIVFVNDKPVTWGCSKQSVVATSTFEAEYMSLAEGMKAGMYIRNLLSSVGEVNRPMTIEVDNKAAKAFAEGAGCNNRTKHVDIRYHFVRDLIDKGSFVLSYIESERNLADLLTKVDSGEVHLKHSLGLMQA